MLFVVLLQVATAAPLPTPAPTPSKKTPVPAPTAVMLSKEPENKGGLSGLAAKRQLNKSVTFDDVKQAGPEPSYTPVTRADCDAGSFKSAIDGAVARFDGELGTARRTPRMALAAQISRLRSLRADLDAVTSKAPGCASEVGKLAGQWMDASISGLDAFLGKDEKESVSRLATAEQIRRRYDVERLTLP